MKTNLCQSDLVRFRRLFKIKRNEISLIFGFGINVWGSYEKDINMFNNMAKSNKTLIKLMLDPYSYNFYLKSINDYQINKIGKYRYKYLVIISDEICKDLQNKVIEFKNSLVNNLYENEK